MKPWTITTFIYVQMKTIFVMSSLHYEVTVVITCDILIFNMVSTIFNLIFRALSKYHQFSHLLTVFFYVSSLLNLDACRFASIKDKLPKHLCSTITLEAMSLYRFQRNASILTIILHEDC